MNVVVEYIKWRLQGHEMRGGERVLPFRLVPLPDPPRRNEVFRKVFGQAHRSKAWSIWWRDGFTKIVLATGPDPEPVATRAQIHKLVWWVILNPKHECAPYMAMAIVMHVVALRDEYPDAFCEL